MHGACIRIKIHHEDISTRQIKKLGYLVQPS